MIDLDNTKRIKSIAYELFIKSQYYIHNFASQDKRVYAITKEISDNILELISDNGLMFISTIDDARDIFINLRQNKDDACISWLLQTSTAFYALAFKDHQDYTNWINHLAKAYSLHRVNDYTYDKNIANICIDEDYLDRLPKFEVQKDILTSNAWLVYLSTLQLSYHEIIDFLVINGNHNQIIRVEDKSNEEGIS